MDGGSHLPCQNRNSNGSHCLSHSGLCYRQVRFRSENSEQKRLSANWEDYIVHYKDFGCVKNDFLSVRLCKHQRENPLRAKECCSGSNCNSDEVLGLTKNEIKAIEAEEKQKWFNLKLHLTVSAISAVALAGVLVLFCRRKAFQVQFCHHVKSNYCKIWLNEQKAEENRLFPTPNFVSQTDRDVSLVMSPNTTMSVMMPEMSGDSESGSGAGPPGLVERTIARQITLVGIKGKGR